MGFSFAALGEPHNLLYNKLKTRGDGEAVGVGVATPYFLQYSEGEARKGEAVKCANVPRPHFANPSTLTKTVEITGRFFNTPIKPI